MNVAERFVAAVAWLEIAASPSLLGMVAGGIVWLGLRSPMGLVAGLLLTGLGVTTGVVFAEKARRQVGTLDFMLRIRAHPELNLQVGVMTLSNLNTLFPAARAEALRTCCGAAAWVAALNQHFPFATAEALYSEAERIWHSLSEADWREAFTHHPKIGDVNALREKFASTAVWAAGEQGAVRQASPEILEALAAGNEAYERKFGYIFIVCATGKSAEEMLALLQARLPNNPETEIHLAMAEQAKITRLRLAKLVAA